MITTDELRILLKINGAASYTTTINEVTNVTKNYDKSVGNLISTLAKLVSGAAIVKFGKQCIEAASNLQEVANVVDVTFGRNAEQVNRWAKSQAANFGLSETAAKRYIGTYGTMAKQFNLTSEQAAAMGIELTKLTGDVASFYNLEDKAAATKLKAIFTGETEGLKELGVVMTETQLSAYALSKGLDKPLKQMTEQEKVLLRYQYTLEKLSHAQGDFARTSDGYANSVRKLKLNFEDLKVEIGNELLPVAAQGIGAVGSILKTLSPFLIGIAQTIRFYAQAWSEASASTKTFVGVSAAAIGVFIIWPKVAAAASFAMKVLTTDIVSVGMALRYTVGILGVFLALLAFKKLTDSVSDMKAASAGVEGLANSAEMSTGAIDDLASSLDGLGDSSKGLDTFLASFDEVNKVGGSSSLMSSLVTADDLNNILGASLGVENLQKELDSLHLPTLNPSGLFTKDFWVNLGTDVMGFLDTLFIPEEFWDNWKLGFDMIIEGIEDIGTWLDKVAPKWSKFFGEGGSKIWDISHDKNGNPKTVGAMALDALLDDNGKDNNESFTGANGVTYAKYRNDGTLSGAYESYIRGNTSKTITNNTTNNTQQPVVYSPNILIDGQKITSVVVDGINAITRSSGNSPLVEMGG